MSTKPKLGTIFRPHVVGTGYIVHFRYDEAYSGTDFAVELLSDGSLSVTTRGSHSDLLSTEHHVSNQCFMRARRYSEHTERHEPYVREEKK
jgi:hypothetical protein